MLSTITINVSVDLEDAINELGTPQKWELMEWMFDNLRIEASKEDWKDFLRENELKEVE